MYQTYLDDSGTDPSSEIAIAAGYVSTESGWRRFAKEWNVIRIDEGFDVFHMAEFVAPNDQGHEPWCDWNNDKKNRVFQRLVAVINDNKRIGVGVALPKVLYDRVPQKIRDHYGNQHYTFAVRMALMEILTWRKESGITQPMEYIFDWEEPDSPKHTEISQLMNNVDPYISPLFGLDTGGFCFSKRNQSTPLQAADILAWEMRDHMRKIYPKGEIEESDLQKVHPNFSLLRLDQELRLGFFSQTNLQDWVGRILAHEKKHGMVP